MRVAGQAIQQWAPQSFLPPFAAFQGSNLPYPVLLASQVLILGVMIFCNLRPPAGMRSGSVLLWLGYIYMSGSLLRIAVGVTVPPAPAWFSAWIPAAFHVVLAGYVLTLAKRSAKIGSISRGRYQ